VGEVVVFGGAMWVELVVWIGVGVYGDVVVGVVVVSVAFFVGGDEVGVCGWEVVEYVH